MMKKTILPAITAAVFAAVLIMGCEKKTETPGELFQHAVRDAAFADEDETLPRTTR